MKNSAFICAFLLLVLDSRSLGVTAGPTPVVLWHGMGEFDAKDPISPLHMCMEARADPDLEFVREKRKRRILNFEIPPPPLAKHGKTLAKITRICSKRPRNTS